MVQATGTVSKGDVSYLTNRFTNIKTSVGVEEAIAAVDKAIKNVKIESTVDVADIINLISKAADNIRHVYRLVEMIGSTETTVIDRLTNSKYTNRWSDDDTSIIDITDNSVVNVLSFEHRYLSTVSGFDNDKLDDCLSMFNEVKDNSEFQPLTLLSLLVSDSVHSIHTIGDLTIKEITFKEIISIMNSNHASITLLEELHNSLNSYKSDIINMDRYDDDATYITKQYKRLKHLNDILDDGYSKVIMKTIIGLSRA